MEFWQLTIDANDPAVLARFWAQALGYQPAPPAADPGITDDERRTIAEMMAKGTYGWIMLATRDLDGTFERLEASGAEVVQEPVDQPYGIRDCAFRDPAGNLIRISEVR